MASLADESTTSPEKTDVDISMTDATDLDAEKTQKNRAVKQVEFYFADSNLPYDKFMWTLHTSDPEHWVPISTVASFKRMREFQAKGAPWVVEALEDSTELEVDESKTKVRRRTEVKEPADQFERSVYAKGFSEETPTLQNELETYFTQFGAINVVRMRRDENKKFKGSVFVEFSHQKSVDCFLNADPKPSWKGEALVIMTKDAYCEMKIKEKGLTGKAAQLRRNNYRKPGSFNGLDTSSKQQKGSSNKKKEIYLQFWNKPIRIYDDGTVKEDEIPDHIDGATLKWEFEGGETPDSISYKDLKVPMKEKFGRPPFINYTKGSTVGYLAFDKKISDEELTFVKETLPSLGNKKIAWDIASPAETQVAHLERIRTAAQAIASTSSSNTDFNPPKEISFVSGSTLRFDLEEKGGEDVNVRFAELKAPLKEHFKNPPFIHYERGKSYGYMAFDDALTDEQITKVEECTPVIGGRKVAWTKANDEEAKNTHEERLSAAARMASQSGSSNNNARGGGKPGRGGRGGGRGGRPKRGDAKGGGDRNGPTNVARLDKSGAISIPFAQGGEKRKRDGVPDIGVSGSAPPSIKRTKTE